MSGKQSRDKGGRGERLVRDKFRRFFPGAERELNDFQGGLGIDLRETGIFKIQVKHYADHVSPNRIKEVKCSNKHIPLIVSWPTNSGTGKPCIGIYKHDFANIMNSYGYLSVIEKRGKTYSSFASLKAPDKKFINVAIFTYPTNNDVPMVLMYLDDFLEVIDRDKISAYD